MALDQRDIEALERVVYKNGDDIAVSIGRSFERIEERMDAAEARIYSRLSDLEDRVEASRESLADEFGEVRSALRELRVDE